MYFVAPFDRGGGTNATVAEHKLRIRIYSRVFLCQDRRKPGHRNADASPPNPHQPSTPPDDRPLPNSPVREIVISERDKQLADIRRASALALQRYVVLPDDASAWAERALREQSMVTSPGPSCASIGAACCWLKFPRGPTETQN